MRDDTLTRCNWCDRPMFCHSLEKTLKHWLLCTLSLHSATYQVKPVFRRAPLPPVAPFPSNDDLRHVPPHDVEEAR